ncbi:hypothetical protein F511_39965 [Dorcoceras hygrometricum]|uniref:Uncharacterized protein n=1 Tax=Dorcoceras hygrometricum TaxID=472368 RepID=A0A2Z7D544_9LAMI|nr:hypothetical protein F511_39965 [Dorcoceras hygrometricum]
MILGNPHALHVLVGFGPAVGRCAWCIHRICLNVRINSSSRNQPLSDRVSCWYFSRCILVGSSNSASLDFSRWCISAYPAVASVQLLVTDLCFLDFVVAAVCGNCSSGAGEILRASGNTSLSSRCWYLLATMRRVVNYHSSWFGQQQVELLMHLVFRVWCKDERVIPVCLYTHKWPVTFLHRICYQLSCSSYWGLTPRSLGAVVWFSCLFSGIPGFTAGRGFNPTGGAPGGS